MLDTIRRVAVRATGAFALALAATTAHASFVGGATSVTFDGGFLTALTANSIAPSPLGTATLTGAVARFPITGNTPATTLRHDGSGLQLFRAASGSNPAVTVQLRDFVIDLAPLPGAPATLTGLVSVNGGAAASAQLFDISSTLVLTLTNGAADAIGNAFGLGTALRGAVVGTAAVQASEPGTLALLAVALAGVFAFGWRRRRAVPALAVRAA